MPAVMRRSSSTCVAPVNIAPPITVRNAAAHSILTETSHKPALKAAAVAASKPMTSARYKDRLALHRQKTLPRLRDRELWRFILRDGGRPPVRHRVEELALPKYVESGNLSVNTAVIRWMPVEPIMV
jgi:hypothetical protein